MKPEMKPTGIEGLYSVKDDGPIGPHHKRVRAVIEDVLGVATLVELECGHTVVVFNWAEWVEKRGGRGLFCGECAGLPK